MANMMMWTSLAQSSGSVDKRAKLVVFERPSEVRKSITDFSSVRSLASIHQACFQARGVDATRHVIIAKALWRNDVVAFFTQRPGCLVGMEACGLTHYWARMRFSIIASRVTMRYYLGRRSSRRLGPSSLSPSRQPIKWNASPLTIGEAEASKLL